MSKSEKEQAIIEAVKNLPKRGYGEFHFYEELKKIVAKVMGYKVMKFPRGDWDFANFKDFENARTIILKMEEKGIIKFSKNGHMFKYIGK